MELLTTIHQVQISRLTAVASQVLFIYDSLLCLDREYQYIWSARWNLGKVLYLLSRYLVLSVNSVSSFSSYVFGIDPPPGFCVAIHRTEAYVGVAQVAVFQATMAMRTNALYLGEPWAKWLLSILFVLSSGGFLAINLLLIPQVHFEKNILHGVITGCISQTFCRGCRVYLRWWWFPLVFFHSVILVMTLFVAIRHSKLQMRTRLLEVMYWDGFIYFALILTTETTQFIMYNVAPDATLSIFYSFARSFCAILCCRLFLNLRGVINKPSQFCTSSVHHDSDSLPLTTVLFAQPATSSGFGPSLFTTQGSNSLKTEVNNDDAMLAEAETNMASAGEDEIQLAVPKEDLEAGNRIRRR